MSTQYGYVNDMPPQSTSEEPACSGQYLHTETVAFLNPNSGQSDVWSFGDLASSKRDENVSQNFLSVYKEHLVVTSNLGSENPTPDSMISEQKFSQQHTLLDPVSGYLIPEHYPNRIRSKTSEATSRPGNNPLNPATNATTFRRQEISSAKGRTGPMSQDARDRAKLIKDIGGACWRCKLVGKGCGPGDPCDSCPRKPTPWNALGCRRGSLWDVLPHVILCPQAGEPPGATPSAPFKRAILNTERDVVIAELANIYLPLPHGDGTLRRSRMLSSAAQYQSAGANNRLIELSLSCLQASLEALKLQKQGQLRNFSHTACTSSVCKIDSFKTLNSYLKEYTNLLSDIIFKKNAKLNKDWWLSVFYSFCIQSFVRRAIMGVVSEINANQATAASQYLHLAVQLFFVSSKATGKGYDPLSYDFDNLSSLESSSLSRNYLQINEGRIAQVAVEKNLWESNEIDSSYAYLGQLFDMDRSIFVAPARKSPTYGDESEKIPINDEAFQPPPKKRRLDKQTKEPCTNEDLIARQNPDSQIIHPGSLVLLDHTAELPPPVTFDVNNDLLPRETPANSSSDMYTPRWIRGLLGEEGWCGFCSRWFKLGDAWFNHRCLFHGICADTGQGFPEPKGQVKMDPRKQIWQAECESCGEKVKYTKGDRRHYSGWYMHAANHWESYHPNGGGGRGGYGDLDARMVSSW